MPDFALSPRSELEHVLKPRRHGASTNQPGVIVALVSNLSLASVIARKGRSEELHRRAKERLGIELPMTPRRQTAETLSFMWAGPGKWLAAASRTAPRLFEQSLSKNLLDLASVTNQSDGRSIIRVSGPKVRETLAKGVPIDLDPNHFPADGSALTTVGHINVHFWQMNAAPTYEFAVFRSFSASFCEWLIDAAAEYGVAIAPEIV